MMNNKTQDKVKLAITDANNIIDNLQKQLAEHENLVADLEEQLQNAQPYKFQFGRYGNSWKILKTYDNPIELHDYMGELWNEYEWRLLDADDKVVKHWVSTFGIPVHIDVLSDNPLFSVFDAFGFTNSQIERFIELWQKSNEYRIRGE